MPITHAPPIIPGNRAKLGFFYQKVFFYYYLKKGYRPLFHMNALKYYFKIDKKSCEGITV